MVRLATTCIAVACTVSLSNLVQAQPTAEISVAGEADTLTVGMSPAEQQGRSADWWLVNLTPQSEWMYYRHPDQWVNVGRDYRLLSPGAQESLAQFNDLQLPGPRYLTAGSHRFYFGVDLEMNGRLDLDQVYYDESQIEVVTADLNRLGHSDLIYRGAFRLPQEFNWGARGLSYYPAGNAGKGSLLVTGFQALMTSSGEPCYEGLHGCSAYFAEVSIPILGLQGDWESLPKAGILRTPTVFDGGLVASVEQAYTFVSGIEYVPSHGSQTTGKLYGSLNAWYPEGSFGDASFPTVWFSELDGSNPQGVFHVGSSADPLFHGRKMGEYLFNVPQWYADAYLGGRTLVTGRSRGTPLSDNGNDSAGGSQGPTLFAFHPQQNGTPSKDLDALAILYYRSRYPGCAGPDVGVGGHPVECDYPGFSMCDEWTGASFVESGNRMAIIILGHKGCTNCYYCDATSDDPNCHSTPRQGECERFCNEGRGYHCGPYKRQILFYNVDRLGQAASGIRDPWTVLPYEIWEPDVFYLTPDNGNTCGDVGGMTYDRDGGRLFVVERGLGGFENENATVIHVWSVANTD